jgi:recombinational DNA repair protein RecR
MPEREKVIKGMELLYDRLLDAAKRDAIAMLDASMVANAIALLKEQEAVVRCKDCKYAYLTDDGECKYCEMEKDDNGFII